MFLLSNIHDRRYNDIYPDIDGVVFDISDLQLSNSRNRDWNGITSGSIVCVVRSSRKVSTFYRIDSNFKTNVVDAEAGAQHVITGTVVAKLPSETDLTTLLNKHSVNHAYLPNNKLSIGFNVANLGNQLGALEVKTGKGLVTISGLEGGA